MAATPATAERKYIDCSEYPSDSNCTVKISGKEEEVLNLAVQHGVATHGHQDTPEFREELRGMLKAE